MKTKIPLIVALGTILVFIASKLLFLNFRFGDGNAYLYMANAVIHGQMPYRDFFLADPPFLVLVLSGFKALFGSHLLLFQAVPIILESLTAFFIYLILKRRGNALAMVSPFVYLFSFTVLATSDFLTGIQLAVFLAALGIYFWDEHPVWSGIFWSLAVLTKLYMFPPFFGFLIYVLWKERGKAAKWITASACTVLAILGPFLLMSFSQVLQYIILHQLHRPSGLDKTMVWQFFFLKELGIIILGLAGLVLSVKNKKGIFALPLIFTALFLIAFQDLYYVYLETLFFFLVFTVFEFADYLWKNSHIKAVPLMLFVLYLVPFSFSLAAYENDFKYRGVFDNADKVATAVANLPKNYDLYGTHEVTPLIALMTGKTLFENYIDTNTQAFASNGEDLKKATDSAVASGVYFMARTIELPQYGVTDFGFDGYFMRDYFKYCKKLYAFQTSDPDYNAISVYECKK